MRRVLFFLLLCASTAHAQRSIDERRPMPPDGFVRIFMLNGTVTVKGWDKDSIAVMGTVYESADERFGFGVSGKSAKMGLWNETNEKLKPSNITVYVPPRTSVWAKTNDSNISVSGVTGGLDLFSVSGSIDVAGNPREVNAETMGGDVMLRGNTTTARVKTTAGALRVNGAITDLTAVTVSGVVDITKTSFAKARLESVDGDIKFTGALADNALLEITTHGGAIEWRAPDDVAARITISQYSGEFVDKLTGVVKKTREFSFATRKTATAQVTLRTFKGTITLLPF